MSVLRSLLPLVLKVVAPAALTALGTTWLYLDSESLRIICAVLGGA
jgi:hypothetical protein